LRKGNKEFQRERDNFFMAAMILFVVASGVEAPAVTPALRMPLNQLFFRFS